MIHTFFQRLFFTTAVGIENACHTMENTQYNENYETTVCKLYSYGSFSEEQLFRWTFNTDFQEHVPKFFIINNATIMKKDWVV